jgi:PKD repeat protein
LTETENSDERAHGDGGGAAGALPVHAYAATGTYNVTLTVTDSEGLTHAAATTAQVADGSGLQPSVARVGGPYRGTVATALSFDGSAAPACTPWC